MSYFTTVTQDFNMTTTILLDNPGFLYTAVGAVAQGYLGVLLNFLVLSITLRSKSMRKRYKISLFFGAFYSFLTCCCVATICTYYLYFFTTKHPANFFTCCAIQKVNYMLQVPFFFALFVTSVDRYLSMCHRITVFSASTIYFIYPLVFIIVGLYLGSLFIYHDVVKDDVCAKVVQFPAWLLRVHLNTYCFLAVTSFLLSLRTAYFVVHFKKNATGGFVQSNPVKSVIEKRLLYSLTMQAVLPIFFIVPFLVRSQLITYDVVLDIPKPVIDFIRVLTYTYYAFNSLIAIFFVKELRVGILRIVGVEVPKTMVSQTVILSSHLGTRCTPSSIH
ncbi:hypothetical protein QR680_006355 [Steinernema hermaphroditum]|uniref:G-protein coupled receptors family 1 profile domain-containing protein n=1 Tax=Steinernema hermaphroditum TaxID=289476 RepID=A0AA39HXI3_9BILA|nr:hypothetical protein QR680_006355 [Steinernema hermaphroditum]